MTTKIGFDLRAIGSPNKSGVENYILTLARDLPAAAPDLEFYFFTDGHSSRAQAQVYIAPNATVTRIPTKKEKFFWRAVQWQVRRHRIGLFHFPICIVPPKFPGAIVVSVYDLTYEVYPEFYQQWEADLQKREIKHSIAIADAVTTISEATKKDIIRFYHPDPDKIYVIYPPLRHEVQTRPKTSVKASVPFLLAIGNIQPRKNFARIIDAFASLPSSKLQLKIVGKPQDEQELERLTQLINQHGLQKRVEITGHVSDETLARLYDTATALVFPSIAEGFGYPIIEAFAHQTPVITSNVSATAEIAAEAALLVNPHSSAQIATAMTKLLDDSALRRRLTSAGTKRLRELSKHSLARETAAVYRAVLQDHAS